MQYFAPSLEINGNAHSCLEIISLRKPMKQQELESTTEELNKVDFSLASAYKVYEQLQVCFMDPNECGLRTNKYLVLQ